MTIKTIKTKCEFGFLYSANQFHICLPEVEKFFELPPNVEKVDIVFHDRPAKNRVKVVRQGVRRYSIDGALRTLLKCTDNVLNPLFEKHPTLYVELQY